MKEYLETTTLGDLARKSKDIRVDLLKDHTVQNTDTATNTTLTMSSENAERSESRENFDTTPKVLNPESL